MGNKVFRENVVIITGASAGIGRALALRLAREGAWLALAARDGARLEAVAAECRAQGGRALAVPTDVSSEDACRALVESTAARYGRIDTLVNNAGITMWARFDEMQALCRYEEIMRVNYLGSVYCTYYALPFLKRTRGRLAAVASVAGKSGVPTRTGYAASKHAQVGFFDSLRIELKGAGVSVTVVCPDFVATEIRERAFGPDGKALGASPVQEGKVMTAETCAEQIAEAIGGRRRARFGLWARLIAPGLVDRIALNAITRGR